MMELLSSEMMEDNYLCGLSKLEQLLSAASPRKDTEGVLT
jgi:hypothetical protein